MDQITVVIADRLGKGQNVAAGAEKAGAKAIVVPGMGADMRLGDVMKEHNADFGISFCGSGGAGALTAQTKYGYPAHYGMRSIEEGVTAIQNGKTVLGFGFMDVEELGERLVKAFQAEAEKK
ncbi:SFCGS family glycine-rich protein [Listeria rocourtiae]|uniref:SFCGS family glycine-rich protein n=1 Tax=Listeria rocourtiae TaxID=647910 RepID=UPI003D2F8932